MNDVDGSENVTSAFFSNFVAFIPTSLKWQMKTIFRGAELLGIAHKIRKGRKSRRRVLTSFLIRPISECHLLGVKRLQRSGPGCSNIG